jgi:hypothetical protein
VDKSATRRPGRRWSVTGGKPSPWLSSAPVTLEALPDGVFDVAYQGGGGLAVALQEQHGRPGLVGDAPPNLHHHATAWARRGDLQGWCTTRTGQPLPGHPLQRTLRRGRAVTSVGSRGDSFDNAPAEFEATYHQREDPSRTAGLKDPSLR